MELLIEEIINSWTHCKELIRSSAKKDVVIAFLEDFKVQFTKFYNSITTIQKNQYHKIAFSMVDKVYFFGGEKGELTHLIQFVNTHWHAKKQITKQMNIIDSIIITILSQYKKTTRKQ